jgi:hypothetical protein
MAEWQNAASTIVAQSQNDDTQVWGLKHPIPKCLMEQLTVSAWSSEDEQSTESPAETTKGQDLLVESNVSSVQTTTGSFIINSVSCEE